MNSTITYSKIFNYSKTFIILLGFLPLFFLQSCDHEHDYPVPPPEPTPIDSVTPTEPEEPTVRVIDSITFETITQFDAMLDSMEIKKVTTVNIPNTSSPIAEKQDLFTLSDITIEGNNLINNTPFPLAEIPVVTILEQDTLIALWQFDPQIPPYSNATLSPSNAEVTGISFKEFMPMFAPRVSMHKNICEGSDTTQTCYGRPTEEHRGVYEVHLANMKNLINSTYFMKELENFYIEKGSNYPEYNEYSGDLDYTYRMYLILASKNHNLILRTMYNVYAAEGLGTWNGTPNIQFGVSDRTGTMAIWEEYITMSSIRPRPYKPATYKTFFHETAHAYSFKHPSGMTYGFADHYGLNMIPEAITEQEQETILPKKNPNIIFDVEHSGANTIHFTLHATQEELAGIKLRIISPDPVSGSMVWNSANEVTLQFNETPTSVVHVMFSNEHGLPYNSYYGSQSFLPEHFSGN